MNEKQARRLNRVFTSPNRCDKVLMPCLLILTAYQYHDILIQRRIIYYEHDEKNTIFFPR